MKKAIIFFLLSLPCYIFGQGVSIDEIEKEVRLHVPDDDHQYHCHYKKSGQG
jgi:hypothetical protein